MIEYYTPQQIAHFVKEEDLGILSTNEVIKELYIKEYAFIDSEYQNSIERFRKETNKYVDFLIFDKEFEKETNKEKSNDYLDEYIEFTKISPNFFLITRLMLLFNKKYRRIKLRTLLNMYGYKRRKPNVISKLQEEIIFYHLKTYHKEDLKDISEFELDEWITIRLYL